MTPAERNNIMQACAFAKVFLNVADNELRGGDSSFRIEAQEQLSAALLSLEDKTDEPD